MIPSRRAGNHERLAGFYALTPDQVEAGMSWLANHNPAVYSATIDAALVWDDGETTVDREPYCMVCRAPLGLFSDRAAWSHYRGDPASGIERYATKHRPVLGWRAVRVSH